MPNESKSPEDYVADALDLMVNAGWVREYARNVKTGIAVDWTDNGKEQIELLWNAFDQLGTDDLTPEILSAIRTLAMIGRPR